MFIRTLYVMKPLRNTFFSLQEYIFASLQKYNNNNVTINVRQLLLRFLEKQ